MFLVHLVGLLGDAPNTVCECMLQMYCSMNEDISCAVKR